MRPTTGWTPYLSLFVRASSVWILAVGSAQAATHHVHSASQVESVVESGDLAPGDTILWADNELADQVLNIDGLHGTQSHPITLRAATPGGVILRGESQFNIGARGSVSSRPLKPADVGVRFLDSDSLAANPPPTGGPDLRVLTYNVQFLPGLVSHRNERRRPLYRADEIGRRLADFDLIGLNEVFDHRPRERLLKAIEKSWNGKPLFVVRGPISTAGRLNGGLAIVSRFPFVATHSMIYRMASSPIEHGWKADGWVAKGVLHARICQDDDRTEGVKSSMLDVFVTHLEARVAKIRHQQIEAFAAFVGKRTSRDFPVIMLGDFNTRGNPEYRTDVNSPYRQMMAAIESALPNHRVVDLWPTLNPTSDGGTSEQEGEAGGRRIDYILVAMPKHDLGPIRPIDIRVNRFLDKRVTALSDHSGVEADFDWRQAR